MSDSSQPGFASLTSIGWPDYNLAYRLIAIAPCVSDVVSAAGGWLFDRARSGWRIHVFTVNPVTPADAMALEILGVESVAPLGMLTSEELQRVAALAIDGEILGGGAIFAQRVHALVQHGATEVVVWGAVPARLKRQCVEVRQTSFSKASRVFKARALSVVGVPARADSLPDEIFGRVASPILRYHSDLRVADNRQANTSVFPTQYRRA